MCWFLFPGGGQWTGTEAEDLGEKHGQMAEGGEGLKASFQGWGSGEPGTTPACLFVSTTSSAS